MDIFISIIKAIIGYVIIIFAGTNLIGIIVRGIIPSYKKDETGNLTLVEDLTSVRSIIITVFSFLLCIAYFYALYHYWNIGVVIAAVIVMFSRLPDLLFEMKTSEKINFRNMPIRPIDVICNVLFWVALPLIWYSLTYLN